LRVDDNLSVAPGSKDLAAAEIELSGRTDRATILRQKMLDAHLDFDYVLFDCPPSLGLLTINALAVAGEVVVPMQPHFLALQGLARLLETVQGVNRQINPRLRVAGIALTMFDANVRLSSEIVGELDKFFDASRAQSVPWNEARVLKARIRRNIRLTECPSFGMSVLKYDSASNGAADYRALAREIATLRAVPSALSTLGASMPAARSLLDRVIDDAERQLAKPRVSVSVPATQASPARDSGMRPEPREVRA
jgi:chromosome partitioning protein